LVIEIEFVVFTLNPSDSTCGDAAMVGKHGCEPEIGALKVLDIF